LRLSLKSRKRSASIGLPRRCHNVLQPLVYHRTVKLSPLAIALSVAVGAQLGGVVGALLGIPFAASLKVVSNELIAWRRGEDPPAVA
jgi:predicted PurR-regulated permease PerM